MTTPTHHPRENRWPSNPRLRAFTLLEVMLAIFIFSLVLTCIYGMWIGILKGSKVALAAAAEVQRSRVAIRAVEDALTTAQLFNDNAELYRFEADCSSDYGSVSMVSRLPSSFPGVGRYGGGDLVVRRVTFKVEPGPDGKNELIMTQHPMLMDLEQSGNEPYTLVLARDVSLFAFDFFDVQKNEWKQEWLYTNQLPKLVRVTLGLGKQPGSKEPHDLETRIIALPAVAFSGRQGAAAAQRAVQPGLPPGAQPGFLPNQPMPPGSSPNYRPQPANRFGR